MSQIISYSCDNCPASGAERLGPIDLGEGPHYIDLCPDCQASSGLNEWEVWLDEYGVPVTVTTTTNRRSPSDSATQCPVCSTEFSGRQYTLTHMQAKHGMSAVEASHALPPRGPSQDCEICGILVAVSGLPAHIRFSHSAVVAA